MATKKKKVKILICPVARFKLTSNVGDIVSYSSNLADELVEAKYAEFVKPPVKKKAKK